MSVICLRKIEESQGERGQAIVEMALALPLLVGLLLGVIEIGRYAYLAIIVADAARTGAVYGAQNLVAAVDPTDIILRSNRRQPGYIRYPSPPPSGYCLPRKQPGKSLYGSFQTRIARFLMWLLARRTRRNFYFPQHISLSTVVLRCRSRNSWRHTFPHRLKAAF